MHALVSSRANSTSGSRPSSRPTSTVGSESGRHDPHAGQEGYVNATDDVGTDDEFDSDDDGTSDWDAQFVELEERLAVIIADVHDLALFTKLNYTGFLKIVKKHDKQTGRPLRREFVQHYLTSRPFYKENYDELILKLSKLYDQVRTRGNPIQGDSTAGGTQSAFVRQTTKYWVHPDNIVPLKLIILKHLPVLVFNPDKEYTPADSAITSIYFDNEDLELYLGRLEKTEGAEAIRLRWYGGMDTKQIFVERKTHREDWTGEKSVKARFPILEEHVNGYLNGSFTMDETFESLRSSGKKTDKEVDSMLQLSHEVQDAILSRKLQPVMRSFYNRTAFQLPGDARVRISLDTELSLVREDNWDGRDRSGQNWRRMDIGIDYPFDQLPQEDIERFPYGVLEVKLQTQLGQEPPLWIRELVASHLVESTPKFSKFLHGCSTLLPNRVDLIPFWLPQMDTDIRKNPTKAKSVTQFERPNLDGVSTHSTRHGPSRSSSRAGSTHYNEPVSEDEFDGAGGDDDEPGEQNGFQGDATAVARALGITDINDPRVQEVRAEQERNSALNARELEDLRESNPEAYEHIIKGINSSSIRLIGLEQPQRESGNAKTPVDTKKWPTRKEILSTSKALDSSYMHKKNKHGDDRDDSDHDDEEDERIKRILSGRDEEESADPSGNVEYVTSFHAPPGKTISVPIRIEPKVYFANERTFLKWLEFSTIVSAMAVGLLNYSKPHDKLGLIVSGLFTILALVCVAYSGVIYVVRALAIRRREASNIYFDAYGPNFLCFVIFSATLANFVLRYFETNESRVLRGLAN